MKRRVAFALLAMGSLACGCGDTIERTQVMVLIDAAPGLRTRIGDVKVAVTSGARGATDLDTVFDGSLTHGARIDWPLEIAVLPRGGDLTREYVVAATALDTAGHELVTLRARSGFVRGRTLSLVLLFDAPCIAEPPDCDDQHSCVAGRCAAASVDPEELPDYAIDGRGLPIATPRAPGPFAPMPDAGAGGMDAGPTAHADAAIDAGGAGADAAPDAAPDAELPDGVDECADDEDDCDPDPDACLDEPRGFRCACPDTHAGDGIGADGCRLRPIAAATGDMHTCMLLANDAVKCWGRNEEGELGLGHERRIGDDPVELGDQLAAVNLGEDRKVVEIVAGAFHNCARFEDGRIKCWGENFEGRLGLGLTDDDNRGDGAGEMGDALPFVELGADFTVAQLAASWTHTCARSNAGAVKCWGTNDVGLLGVGDTEPRGDSAAEMGDALPVVDLGGMPAVEVVVGDYHNCARFEDGRAKCWGANYFSGGDQARGDQAAEMGDQLPFVELGSELTVIQLSAGGYHMCALLSDDRVKCWGDNAEGQLGQGHVAYRGHQASEMGDNLAAVDLGGGLRPVQIVSGLAHNCARFEGGRVKCWGANDRAQLGLGDTEHRGDGPGEMGDALPFVDLGPDAEVARLATQENHTCALLVDGRVKCWGDNDQAQLGLGDTSPRGDSPADMGAALPALDLGSR